jgi:hypothetical protein
MEPDDWQLVEVIIVGTLPLLVCVIGVLATSVWNLLEVKSLRARFDIEMVKMQETITAIRERIAKIEQRPAGD